MVGFVGENMDFFWLKRKWKEKGRFEEFGRRALSRSRMSQSVASEA